MVNVTVVAKVVAREDAIESVKAALLKLVAPTRQEEGCLEYRLHQDNDNPALFLFYENWKSLSCLEQHMKSDHFRNYCAAVEGKLVKKVVNKLTEIG